MSFDADPAAIAWARGKVQDTISRLRADAEVVAGLGEADHAAELVHAAEVMEAELLGRPGHLTLTGERYAAFDADLPAVWARGERAAGAEGTAALRARLTMLQARTQRGGEGTRCTP